ncbi:pre-mrna-splicing factor 18 [Nannochloropsis gaditana]|uniref:Pre-mRNA-splicing factor 18 n=2 Tax=Nannochloropsis gaditana TaxID=72520 RepID=W7U1L9_9STRA|nr:pre-mrna-splicing factor 18 [Nannochloropsis gaditana]
METKTQKQCKDYIRPLFKLCKAKQVPDGIRANLIEMVDLCEAGEFVKAHEVYLRTAIGNAPWPIGITMVGIHERTGREKISSSKVAHIMNNEMQRKYLTSIKRLMRFAQEKRPDVDPSKKFL